MRVVVLLSSYQGEKYISEQIESILVQLPLNGSLIIRDDGSTDGTVRCAQQFQDARIQIMCGENLGFVRSFFTLLENVPEDADIIMLSDQDDVWLPNKIDRAVSHLQPLENTPGLYCSRLMLVDDNLERLGLSPSWPLPGSFRNALTENIVTGCTCALNRAALPLAQRYGDVSRIYFHDWWLYLVVSAFGKIVIDPEPTILYRQHGNNAIGMGAGMTRYLAIFRFLGKKNWVHIMYNQIENFRVLHAAHLAPADYKLFEKYFNPVKPATVARLLFLPVRFRQSIAYDILLRLLLLASILAGRGLTSSNTDKTKT